MDRVAGHHLKGYNNDIMNPALPPKLHKSLTNLKTSSSAASSSTGHNNHHHQQQQQQQHNNTNVIATSSSSATTNTSHRNNTSSHKMNEGGGGSSSANCSNTINGGAYSSTLNPSSTSTYLAAAATGASSTNCSSPSPSASTTSVQTIYTLSKPSSSSLSAALIGLTNNNNNTTTTCTPPTPSNRHATKDHHDHIMKIQPPSLTLPLSTTSTTSSFTSSTSKINSSTFYPLQNNVTYTLPKNVGGGKMSLNSTINSVVSKVPSVISLPPTGSCESNITNYHGHGYSGLLGGANDTGAYNSHQYLNEMHGSSSSPSPAAATSGSSSSSSKSTTLPKILRSKQRDVHQSSLTPSSNLNCNTSSNGGAAAASSSSTSSSSNNYAVSQCSMPAYPKQYTANSSSSANNSCNSSANGASSTTANNSDSHSQTKQLPVCTTSKNCLNPKEHFLPNDTSLDDDYLSECENCKIAQSSKYYLNAEQLTSVGGGPQETMTLQRKSLEECKDEPETGYYRISHTLPTNSKKNAPVKTNNRDQWFSTIPAASSSSEEDINE
ncbi:uncharacterized protein LOC133334971 [Musca vetustissima]|uniref:uncharacterized protein LOC133334971 n=1 Tax=Musca vetustissima TaxID=27455 RepID=UPI002AB6CAB0|nr:uncharacterized protein LOC133334971 [Musca vetustissima]